MNNSSEKRPANDGNSAPEQSKATKPNRRFRRLMIWLVAVVSIWLAGDFTYSKVVERAVANFEATIERDKDGVQVGARSWSLTPNFKGPAESEENPSKVGFLLVHGFNDTPKTFEQMGRRLSGKGFHIYAVRMPGFGVHVDQMKECTYQQWVAKITTEAKQLREKYDSVFIVGHSLGGAVSIAAVDENPNLFDGLILLAPGIDVANHRSPLFPTRFWRGLGDRLLYFSTVYQSPYDRNDCRDPEFRNPPDKPPFSTRNIVQQSFQLMDRNIDCAPKIKLPVLMALSRDDQVIDWMAAEKWYQQLGSGNRDLKFYDQSGHALTVDYDWKNITEDIVEFIEPLARAATVQKNSSSDQIP